MRTRSMKALLAAALLAVAGVGIAQPAAAAQTAPTAQTAPSRIVQTDTHYWGGPNDCFLITRDRNLIGQPRVRFFLRCAMGRHVKVTWKLGPDSPCMWAASGSVHKDTSGLLAYAPRLVAC